MITLKNESMTVCVDEEYGATITAVIDEHGVNALACYDWRSPIPARHSVSYGNDDLDFHSGYRGGWQETFPNAGLPSVVDGVPHPFHGEAAVSSWKVEHFSELECELTVAARSPLLLRRAMFLDPVLPVLRIEGEVRNEGHVEVDFVWGHHPAFPAVAGTVVDYPEGALCVPDDGRPGGLLNAEFSWPRAVSTEGAPVDVSVVPDSFVHRLLYVHGLRESWAAVRQPEGLPSVALAWDLKAFPVSWLWVMRDDPGFPFYGRARMLALEAQTSWPYDGLTGARERNMAHTLAPGESMTSWYTMVLLSGGSGAVKHVDRSGHVELVETCGG